MSLLNQISIYMYLSIYPLSSISTPKRFPLLTIDSSILFKPFSLKLACFRLDHLRAALKSTWRRDLRDTDEAVVWCSMSLAGYTTSISCVRGEHTYNTSRFVEYLIILYSTKPLTTVNVGINKIAYGPLESTHRKEQTHYQIHFLKYKIVSVLITDFRVGSIRRTRLENLSYTYKYTYLERAQ